MSDRQQTRQQFDVAVRCPKCGYQGVVRWEENEMGPRGPERTLVTQSTGFSKRPGSNDSGDATIYCEKCGIVQAD